MTVDRKQASRTMTNYAIRHGFLKRGPCEICGTNERIEVHHEDYDKPLDVMWLCKKHHTEKHRGPRGSRSSCVRKHENKSEVVELKNRMRECGITATEMCRDLGMSRATLHRWLKGGDRLQSKWDAVEKYVSQHEDLKLLNEVF